MSNGVDLRSTIFQKYSKHLTELYRNGILTEEFEEGIYLCPICIRPFTIEDLDQNRPNPLTLEDVPPISLGGTASILTCYECNNSAGTKYDYHLVNAIHSNSNSSLIPNSQFPVNVEREGNKYSGILSVNEDGNLIIAHNVKKNHPVKLNDYIGSVGIGELVNINVFSKDVDESKASIAILKTAYLLIFQKYGYSFIWRPSFDLIRQQLRHPEKFYVKTKFIKEVPFKSQTAPFLIDTGIECIFPTFCLKFNSFSQWFSVIVPFTNKKSEEIFDEMIRRTKEQDGKYSINGDTMDGDYLFDFFAIKKMLTWMNSRD